MHFVYVQPAKTLCKQMFHLCSQVKEQLGKDQYKHRLLPLLRQYRQTKDASHFTSGMPGYSDTVTGFSRARSAPPTDLCWLSGLRSLATPLLPNADLLQAFSLLLPKALQKAFIAQLEVGLRSPAASKVDVLTILGSMLS